MKQHDWHDSRKKWGLKDGANRSSLGWSVCWRSCSGTQCLWNPSLESHHKLCPVRKCCLKMRRKKSCGWLKVCRRHAGRKIHFRSSFYCREAETVKAAGSLLHQCSPISEKWSVKLCDSCVSPSPQRVASTWRLCSAWPLLLLHVFVDCFLLLFLILSSQLWYSLMVYLQFTYFVEYQSMYGKNLWQLGELPPGFCSSMCLPSFLS